MRWKTWTTLSFVLLGCAKPPTTKAPDITTPVLVKPVRALDFDPLLVEPAREAVDDELTTIVTTSDDELIAFVERRTSPETLAADSPLRERRPTNGVQSTRIEMHDVACFARRTARDARGAIVRTSSHGFLIPPTTWMAEVVRLPGTTEDDARAWYKAMSQRLATSGRATGIAQFENGNAIAILLELRRVAPGDTELVAKTQFFKAGDYTVDAWGPVVRNARSVDTRAMNNHKGVSVFDLLRSLRVHTKPVITT